MTIRLWFPSLATATLALACLSAERSQAGSFFGPSCYGADYGYQYPQRSHNAFGCGPGTSCAARHPLFKHRWLRKHPGAPVDGAPANGMPVEPLSAPVVQEPFRWSPPVQAASVIPAPIVAAPMTSAPLAPAPAVSGRLAPIPAPMPSAPVSSESPPLNQSSKPPF